MHRALSFYISSTSSFRSTEAPFVAHKKSRFQIGGQKQQGPCLPPPLHSPQNSSACKQNKGHKHNTSKVSTASPRPSTEVGQRVYLLVTGGRGYSCQMCLGQLRPPQLAFFLTSSGNQGTSCLVLFSPLPILEEQHVDLCREGASNNNPAFCLPSHSPQLPTIPFPLVWKPPDMAMKG